MTVERVAVPDEPQTLEIAGGELHRWRFDLQQGQVVTVRVEQEGIDVVLRLLADSGGTSLGTSLVSTALNDTALEMDAPSGSWGSEELTWVAERSSSYHLEIVAPNPGVTPGRYQLTASTPHATSAAERGHAAAVAQLCRGDALRKESKVEEALKLYHQSFETWARLEITAWQLEALQRIGSTRELMNDRPGARAAYAQARQLAADNGLVDRELANVNRLTALALQKDQPEPAGALLEQAAELAEKTTHQGLQGAVDSNRALYRAKLGDTDGALEIFLELTRRWDTPGRDLEQADAFHNLAAVLNQKTKFAEAADAYARCADARRRGGNLVGWAMALVGLADARLRAGDPAATIAALTVVFAAEGPSLLDGRWQALARNTRGLAYARLGRAEEALAELEAAAAGAEVIGHSGLAAVARFNQGALLLREQQPAEALLRFRAALEVYKARQNSTRQAMAHLGIGQALEQLGSYQEALPHLKTALEKVESLRFDHGSWDFRMWFLASKQQYFEELIAVLMSLHEHEPPPENGPSFAEQALRVAERRRARTFLDALAEAPLRNSVPSEVLEEERQKLNQLRELETLLQTTERDERDPILARRRGLMVELESVRSRIASSSPMFAETNRPKALGSEEMQNQLLDDDTRLLIYSLGEDRSFLWSVRRDEDLQVYSLPSRRRIEAAVADALELVKTVSDRKQDERRAALARLADHLLGDLHTSLGTERLAIVPDGLLELVPWAALRIPVGANNEPGAEKLDRVYLLEHHEITILPSASALHAIRQEAPRRPRPSWELSIFADPVFSADDPRVTKNPKNGATGELPEPPESLSRTARGLGLGKTLARLPGTAAEAQAIAQFLPPELTYLVSGFDARNDSELHRFLEHSRVLHFATHGLIDRERPESSTLVLSLVDEAGEPLDGYLYAHELYSTQIAAELVVLSACETGVGREIPGEGIQGLARGFLYAGAPRVIMSLWQVADAQTAQLMGELYRQMLDLGNQPVAALRLAQLHLLQTEALEAAEPFYWAGFQHLGDWQQGAFEMGSSLDDSIAQEATGTALGGPGGDDPDYPGDPDQLILEDDESYGEELEIPGFDPDHYVNGIDLETGLEIPYQEPPPASSRDELLAALLGSIDPIQMQWWIENFAIDDPERLPVYKVDPEILSEAGWAIAFTPSTPLEVKEKLAPLLELRKEQAGNRYRRIEIEPGWTNDDFRNKFEIGFGPADPEVLPYYLLLVGDPAEIPFELQYGLDVQYAVGRLCFDKVDDYHRYALTVKNMEREPPKRRETAIFGVDAGSPRDRFMLQALVDPLTRKLQAWSKQARPSTQVRISRAQGDRKVDLEHLLENPPGLLFAAGHGLDCSKKPTSAPSLQGALVCSNRNAEGKFDRDSYFSGKDLEAGTDLQGMITLLFACYGAGTPKFDNFSDTGFVGRPKKIAQKAFVSHLAKQMLASGAQALVGHIDRAWSLSFSWSRTKGDQVKVFDSICRQLLDGHRLGHCMEWVNQRYAEGSTELNRLLTDRSLSSARNKLLPRVRKATYDARNYVIIGDPAVRLPGFGRWK